MFLWYMIYIISTLFAYPDHSGEMLNCYILISVVLYCFDLFNAYVSTCQELIGPYNTKDSTAVDGHAGG